MKTPGELLRSLGVPYTADNRKVVVAAMKEGASFADDEICRSVLVERRRCLDIVDEFSGRSDAANAIREAISLGVTP